MNKLHQIHIPIYEQYVDVWFGDKDECKKALEKKKLPKDCIDFFYETMNKFFLLSKTNRILTNLLMLVCYEKISIIR